VTTRPGHLPGICHFLSGQLQMPDSGISQWLQKRHGAWGLEECVNAPPMGGSQWGMAPMGQEQNCIFSQTS